MGSGLDMGHSMRKGLAINISYPLSKPNRECLMSRPEPIFPHVFCLIAITLPLPIESIPEQLHLPLVRVPPLSHSLWPEDRRIVSLRAEYGQ